MSTFVERAPTGRATCRVCDQKIARGAPRVAETEESRFNEERYMHFSCVVGHDFDTAHAALVSSQTSRELRDELLATLDASEPRLARSVRAMFASRSPAAAASAPPVESLSSGQLDEAAQRLLAQLVASPADRSVLQVLADHLQQRGDARGELIALDLAAGSDPAQAARQLELRARLLPRLGPRRNVGMGDGFGWGIGFLKLLRLDVATDRRAALEHPSAALLHELDLGRTGWSPFELPLEQLPRALRRLTLRAQPKDGAVLELGALPHLEELRFEYLAPLRVLHPSLRKLTLTRMRHPVEPFFAPGLTSDLPRLSHLVVDDCHGWSRPVADALAASGCLATVERLGLTKLRLTEADVAQLEVRLEGRRLQSLDVSGNALPPRCEGRLRPLCEELTFATAPRIG